METAAKKQKTDDTTDAPIGEMRVANTSSTGLTDTSGRTSETPVSIPPTITYGLQETHTTVLPAICWFSCPNLALDYTPTTFKFRLNGIYGLMSGAIKSAVTPNACWIKKVGETTYYNNTNVGYNFPNELANDDWSYMRLWWRETWERLYMYYTVLGVEYELVFSGPGIAGRKSLIATTIQTSGSAQNTSVYLPDNVPLRELYGMKNIDFHELKQRDNGATGSNMQVIKGTYKPGTALRDISNDGDVKLWSKTDHGGAGSNPAYEEYMQVMSYMHPMSTAGTDPDGAIPGTGEPPASLPVSSVQHNVQVRLKYIVQFKQLRGEARYPLQSNADPSRPIIQYPSAANPHF
jgi:hypothetical protein